MSLLVASALAGEVRPTLSIRGDCPELLILHVGRMTPSGTFDVLHSAEGEGRAVVTTGPCAGTRTGLADVTPISTQSVNAFGRRRPSPTVGEWFCDGTVQLLDLTTCAVSNVAAAGPVLGTCEADVEPPPPDICPPECNGGCEDATCIIDCSSPDECPGDIICPDNLDCLLLCRDDYACDGDSLVCPTTGTCEVDCTGRFSCENSEFIGGTGHLDIQCTGNYACMNSHLTCGEGACHSTCRGRFANLEEYDCGSSCDCASTCR